MGELFVEVQGVHNIGDRVGRVGGGVSEVVNRYTKVVSLTYVDLIVNDTITNILLSVNHFHIHDFECFIDRDYMGCYR